VLPLALAEVEEEVELMQELLAEASPLEIEATFSPPVSTTVGPSGSAAETSAF